MSKSIFIKPAPGCLVRDDETMRPLAQAGEWKPINVYWLRRLLHGDVVRIEEPSVTAAKGDA